MAYRAEAFQVKEEICIYFYGSCLNNNQKDLSKRKTYGCYIISPVEKSHNIEIFDSTAKTSNEAEYDALIHALKKVKEFFPDITSYRFIIRGDSNLVVNQTTGHFRKVKNNLLPFLRTVRFLLGQIGEYEIHHVHRERNPAGRVLEAFIKNPSSWDYRLALDKSEFVDKLLKSYYSSQVSP